jgi:hypothetical protein
VQIRRWATNACGQDNRWFTDGAAFRASLAETSDGAPIRASMAKTPNGAAIRVSLVEIPNGMGYNSLTLIQMSG